MLSSDKLTRSKEEPIIVYKSTCMHICKYRYLHAQFTKVLIGIKSIRGSNSTTAFFQNKHACNNPVTNVRVDRMTFSFAFGFSIKI